jgi:uncharacterized protein (UPF0332 family)
VTDENRLRNLQEELALGDRSMKAAEALAALQLWEEAVGRAYYAAFHHVRALLFSMGLEAKTHTGTHNLLYMHFVRPGTVHVTVADHLAELQRYREQADYARGFRLDEAHARTLMDRAGGICRACRDRLQADGWLPTP